MGPFAKAHSPQYGTEHRAGTPLALTMPLTTWGPFALLQVSVAQRMTALCFDRGWEATAARISEKPFRLLLDIL